MYTTSVKVRNGQFLVIYSHDCLLSKLFFIKLHSFLVNDFNNYANIIFLGGLVEISWIARTYLVRTG